MKELGFDWSVFSVELVGVLWHHHNRSLTHGHWGSNCLHRSRLSIHLILSRLSIHLVLIDHLHVVSLRLKHRHVVLIHHLLLLHSGLTLDCRLVVFSHQFLRVRLHGVWVRTICQHQPLCTDFGICSVLHQHRLSSGTGSEHEMLFLSLFLF